MALWDIKGSGPTCPFINCWGGSVDLPLRSMHTFKGAISRKWKKMPKKAMAKGYRHIRVQVAVPGLATYGTGITPAPSEPARVEAIGPTNPKFIWEPGPTFASFRTLATLRRGTGR